MRAFKQVNASFAQFNLMQSFTLCTSPPCTQTSERQLSAGMDLSGSALMEQIRCPSSELRRREWEICVTLTGPEKTKKSKKSSAADTRTQSETEAATKCGNSNIPLRTQPG